MHSIAFYTHRVFTLDGWKSKKLMPYLDNAIFPPSKIKLALGRFVSKFWNESFGKKSRFRVAVSGRDIGLFFRWGGIRTSEEITPVWYLSIEDFFKILELYESMNSFFEFSLVESSLVEALIGRERRPIRIRSLFKIWPAVCFFIPIFPCHSEYYRVDES